MTYTQMPAPKTYPFSAIVGQEKMKKALLCNIINPALSGVLIRGEKGTAKSTAVRALSNLLPEIAVAEGCPFGCDVDNISQCCPACAEAISRNQPLETEERKVRVVELPVGSTEDRVIGTLDLEKAIQKGEKHFEPGILAQANRGILYVDEVNLLDDHIVDILLDAAAMGVNTVEREGISYTHPARFVLIGTMNPEEGEIRPQLMDRFGLCVQIEGISDTEARMAVVKNRALFEEDPTAFCREKQQAENDLSKKIVAAQKTLRHVILPDDLLRQIVEISVEMGVDGHRADIVMMKAAKTLAALDGRKLVNPDDVLEAAEMALPHRMRKKPFQEIGVETHKLQRLLKN